jgi:uncharacterized protein (TIGR02001 family)
MNRIKKTATVIIGAAAFTACLQAADVNVDGGIYSEYVWRGQVLDDRPAAQGGLTVAHPSGAAFNVWGNYSLDSDASGQSELNEVDYTLSYGGALEGVSYEIGFISYTFPNTNLDDTSEIYISAGLDLPLAPTFTVYYDIEEINGIYANAAISHGMDVSEALSMEIGASIGVADGDYIEGYFGGAEKSAALQDMNVYLSSTYALSETVSLSGLLQYTFMPDGSMEDLAGANYFDKDAVVGGVSLSYSF